MYRVPFGAALVAVALFAAPACAATLVPPPLDLRDAVRYALAHDPTVLGDRATVAQNESTFAKNHAAEFPTLAGSLQNQVSKSMNVSGQYSQFGLQPPLVFSQNTAQVGSTYTLYNGSLNQINAQQARRQLEASRATLHRAEQSLAADVAAAFFNAAQQREAVRLAEGDRAYQGQLLDAARAQERVGRIAGVDVLRAQVNTLRSEASLTTARTNAVNAVETLAQRIGAPPDTPFALPDVLPEPAAPAATVDTLVDTAISARADIASARAQLAAARLADRAIESDRLPQLQMSGSFGQSETPAGAVTPGFPAVSPSRPGFWQIGASETMTVPFIEYGARRAAHRAARAQIDAAESTVETTASGVALDVRESYRGVQTASANLQTSREAERLGEESARIAQLQYRNGLISLTDATAAQQSALSAANDLIVARVNYLNALIRLRASVGIYDPLAVVAPGVP